MHKLPEMVELSGAELDAVTGGQPILGTVGSGLVVVGANVNDAVDIGDVNIEVLRNGVQNNDIVKNVGVGVAVAAGILGNAGAAAPFRVR